MALLPRTRPAGKVLDSSNLIVTRTGSSRPGVNWAATDFQRLGPFTLNVTGDPGSLPPSTPIRLYNRTTGHSVAGSARDDGSFAIDLHGVVLSDRVELFSVAQKAEALAARSSTGLDVLDAADPSRLRRVGRLPIEGEVRAVRVFPAFPRTAADGKVHPTDLAFVLSKPTGLVVVDLSDARDPRRIGSLALPAPAFDLAFDPSGRRALVNLGSDGLALIDISRPDLFVSDAEQLVLARIALPGDRLTSGPPSAPSPRAAASTPPEGHASSRGRRRSCGAGRLPTASPEGAHPLRLPALPRLLNHLPPAEIQ